jgi:hypothetical protein
MTRLRSIQSDSSSRWTSSRSAVEMTTTAIRTGPHRSAGRCTQARFSWRVGRPHRGIWTRVARFTGVRHCRVQIVHAGRHSYDELRADSPPQVNGLTTWPAVWLIAPGGRVLSHFGWAPPARMTTPPTQLRWPKLRASEIDRREFSQNVWPT